MNCAAIFVFFAILPAASALKSPDPLTQTIQMLDELTAKIEKEGKADEKVFEEYSKWCDDSTKNLGFVIERGTQNSNDLKAVISKANADIAALDEKIEQLAEALATDYKELNAAKAVRNKETAEFSATETSMLDGISTLGRTASIIQREMQKHSTAFAQVDVSDIEKVFKAMNTVIDSATLAFPIADQKKVEALVQAHQESTTSDENDLGAPAPEAYTSWIKPTILETLRDMKDKAEKELSDMRKAEADAQHNFEMLYAALIAQQEADIKDQNEAKASKAAIQEEKATAEGDLAEVSAVLENDKETLATTIASCTRVASDYKTNQGERMNELHALQDAHKILEDPLTQEIKGKHLADSFLQMTHQSRVGSTLETGLKMTSRADLANAEVVNLLNKLAQESHSPSLSQLATRVAAAVRYGADPFSKVKQLITDMVNTLEEEAHADMTEKAYCDEELGKSEAKKSDLNAQLSKLTSDIDKAAAKSAKLKLEVKDLQAAMAEDARSQAEMDAMRQEAHEDYLAAHADISSGLDGVRKALGVLRDYYNMPVSMYNERTGTSHSGQFDASMLQAPEVGGPTAPELKVNREAGHLVIHDKSTDAGGKVIEVLEYVEADYSKHLLDTETAEEVAVEDHKKATYDLTHSTGMKAADVKYKTKEYKSLDKSLTEFGSDRDSATTELDAVLEYYGQIKERCIAKPESYATRSARRESEIAGLQEALSILEGQAVFAQRGKKSGLNAAFLASS